MQTVKYYYVPQYSMFMVLHVKRIIILAEIISQLLLWRPILNQKLC